jgi:hypothetical protein
MKKHLALIGALLWAPAALAQVNVVPQVGVTTAYLEKQTYSAAFIGLAPAASATDVVCLAGSATKTVKLREIRLSGSAGTLVTLPVTLLMRTTADTGGTAASTTANPANTIAKRDSNNATATATPISYTANPTINDTSPTYVDSASLTLPTTAAGTVTVPLHFSYLANNVGLTQAPTLRGAAQQLCLNFNAVSVSSGVLNGSITWTEE